MAYVLCFISFTFAFKIDHVQQVGERMESIYIVPCTVTHLGGWGPQMPPLVPALDGAKFEAVKLFGNISTTHFLIYNVTVVNNSLIII